VKSARPPATPIGFGYRPDAAKRTLHCDGVALAQLAKRYGTPLYVYSSTQISDRLRAFDGAFSGIPHTICYSVKANSNLSILRMLGKQGCGFDVVSSGELARVLRSGSSARNVVFSGVGKTRQEMEAALRADILLFNVESESELNELAACAKKVKRVARLALRVNPDVSAKTHPYISTGLREHKFGIRIDDAPRLYAEAAKSQWLKVAGVSVHIGSQITDVKPFSAAMARVAALVVALRKQGHPIDYIDAGGGLGISYQPGTNDDFAKVAAKYAKALIAPLKHLGIHLLLEPGRSIVGPAGALLTRVIYKKKNGNKKFIVVDAAMNDLIRPSLYQAHHQIIPVESKAKPRLKVVDVVGPICETGDFFARDRELPDVNEGDLLAILDAGAYGMSLSSNYNSRPRAAEVLVQGKTAKLIRKRESVADLLRNEI
jgi:diaminopimelate decarboxylase